MLKYIGNGNFYPGIPGRDLTDEEVHTYGKILVTPGQSHEAALLATGLYEKPTQAAAKKDGVKQDA